MIEKSNWASGAIKEALNNGKSYVVMESNELIDFLKVAKGSYGIHTEHMDGLTRRSIKYLPQSIKQIGVLNFQLSSTNNICN
jgi:hypothetical protein